MQKNRKVTLSIIIVNWNSGDHLRRCILSIEKAKNEKIEIKEIIIVDNGSTDDSLGKIHDLISATKIHIIRNLRNFVHLHQELSEGEEINEYWAKTFADICESIIQRFRKVKHR